MKNTNNLDTGFTLIELMIVVAVASILATMAMPTYQDYVIRTQISEAIGLTDSIKQSITEYYKEYKSFPVDNHSAGLPQPQYLIGNFVTAMNIVDGAIHISLGNNININAAGKTLTIRPASVTDSPNSPISWLCGYTEPVIGMQAAGENKTSVPNLYLSPACRLRTRKS